MNGITKYCDICSQDTGSKNKICQKCEKKVYEAKKELMQLIPNLPDYLVFRAVKEIKDMIDFDIKFKKCVVK